MKCKADETLSGPGRQSDRLKAISKSIGRKWYMPFDTKLDAFFDLLFHAGKSERPTRFPSHQSIAARPMICAVGPRAVVATGSGRAAVTLDRTAFLRLLPVLHSCLHRRF